MENHHVQWENPQFLWPFSIANRDSHHQVGSPCYEGCNALGSWHPMRKAQLSMMQSAKVLVRITVSGSDITWLVASIPLKYISQLGWLFPIYGKLKNVPNHQPVTVGLVIAPNVKRNRRRSLGFNPETPETSQLLQGMSKKRIKHLQDGAPAIMFVGYNPIN